MGRLAALTRPGISLAEETADFFLYFGKVCAAVPRGLRERGELGRQLMHVGVGSFPVVFFTAAFTGAVIALQTYTGFIRFRTEGLVGSVVALSMLREVTPVLAALMVTARVGSAMAAEVGSMRAAEQIDALVAMGTDPIEYLFVPRVLAGATMLPLLVVLGDFVAIVGGRIAATTLLGANSVQYDDSTFAYLDLRDFWSGVVKASAFGLLFTLICCQKGYQATGGAAGVGHATTRAVVSASLSVVIVDFFLSKLLFVL
ncbi:MAG: ABC transporter permease [Myxococcaceae bacterium]|nr:ABC transporter permease [Myxococcaceae bacterium]